MARLGWTHILSIILSEKNHIKPTFTKKKSSAAPGGRTGGLAHCTHWPAGAGRPPGPTGRAQVAYPRLGPCHSVAIPKRPSPPLTQTADSDGSRSLQCGRSRTPGRQRRAGGRGRVSSSRARAAGKAECGARLRGVRSGRGADAGRTRRDGAAGPVGPRAPPRRPSRRHRDSHAPPHVAPGPAVPAAPLRPGRPSRCGCRGGRGEGQKRAPQRVRARACARVRDSACARLSVRVRRSAYASVRHSERAG
jgi:hypothetical protein